MKLVPRLASPVGFLLALLFFFLPFVAVSCDAPGIGEASATYSGLDLATNGEPAIEATGMFNELKDADPNNPTKVEVPQKGEPVGSDVQALAIFTVALLVIGLGVSLAPVLRIRTFGALGGAVVGGTLLVVTEAVAQSNLESALDETARQSASDTIGDLPNINSLLLGDLVHSRYGYWLSLTAVILVLLFNAGLLLWPRIRAATQQPAPLAEPPPPAEPVASAEPESEPPPAQ